VEGRPGPLAVPAAAPAGGLDLAVGRIGAIPAV